MLKIMIVDDESMVRIGVKSCINWEHYDLEVIGEASNGKEAIDLFEKLKPDIILTDIKMPLLDGIELIKSIMLQSPHTKIIVLSCLNEYDYVREAMKHGAVDYLFKPTMTPEDILDVLKDVKEKIKLERNKNIEIKQLKEQANQSMKLMKEKYLNNLLNSDIKVEQNIKKDFEKMDINLQDKKLICFLIEFDEHEKLKEKYSYNDVQMLYLSCINAITDIMKQYNNGVCFMNENKKIIVLHNINHHSQMNQERKLIEITKKIQGTLNNYVGISISIGVSNIFNGFNNLKIAFIQAEQALNQKFMLGKGRIIKYGAMNFDDKNLKELFSSELNKLYEAAKLKNQEETIKNVNSLFLSIKEKTIPTKEDICELAIEIIIEFLRIFREEVTLEEFFKDRNNMLNEVHNNKTFDEINEWLKNIINKLLVNVQKKDTNKYSPTVYKAINYISKNYAENVTLLSISEHVNVSKNYFSKLFKEETGINFVQYLTNIRVKHAKELLISENIKTYEVSQMVGYKNYRHFCKIFKKNTGITPSEVKMKYTEI